MVAFVVLVENQADQLLFCLEPEGFGYFSQLDGVMHDGYSLLTDIQLYIFEASAVGRFHSVDADIVEPASQPIFFVFFPAVLQPKQSVTKSQVLGCEL